MKSLRISSLIILVVLAGCPNPGGGSATSANSTGEITGHARLAGQTDNSGILVSADSVDSSGKTLTIKQAITSRSMAVNRSLAGCATTDSSGAYTLSGLAPGSYTVYASSQSSLEKAVSTGVTVVAGRDVTAADLNLTPTGQISGSAQLNGSPAMGIIVYVAGTSFSAMTDGSGNFVISSVPAATGYTLIASMQGCNSTTASANVAAGTTTTLSAPMNLTPLTTLPGTGTITGTVRLGGASSGNTGIFVYLPETSYITMTTADSGAFSITNIAPDAYSAVVASKVGYISAQYSGTITVSVGNATTVPQTLTLTPATPQIQSISAYPQPVMTAANMVCSATDPNGYSLSYSWTVAGISGIAAGANAIWSSVGIPGYLSVGVTVSNGMSQVTGASSMTIGSASPWPKFRRDFQGTGASPMTSNGSGALKWSYTTGNSIYSSPAIGADGTIYVGSSDDKLYAVY
jgi:PQQ-like domain/Carboxypeptidase regulatory-like domain